MESTVKIFNFFFIIYNKKNEIKIMEKTKKDDEKNKKSQKTKIKKKFCEETES